MTSLQDELVQIFEALEHNGGHRRRASEELGIHHSTLYRKLQRARDQGIVNTSISEDGMRVDISQKPFKAAEIPTSLPTVEELISARKKQFSRRDAKERALDLVQVQVKIKGPIGILHMGDPHIDDDGTDIAKIESHVNIINQTEGMFGANVGDLQNNWVGRLSSLWANQSTSSAEAWLLVEWLVRSVQWLYLIKGNHDMWTGTSDPLDWITRGQKGVTAASGLRLSLKFPNGAQTRINARHDFPGHSMWNTAHGAARAAQMGWRDSILICGHTHVSGYQVLKDPMTGLISHAIRVASYKTHDDYADRKSFPDQNIFCAPVTIIDPDYPDNDPRHVTFVTTPEEGADYLTWKRSRWEKGRSGS